MATVIEKLIGVSLGGILLGTVVAGYVGYQAFKKCNFEPKPVRVIVEQSPLEIKIFKEKPEIFKITTQNGEQKSYILEEIYGTPTLKQYK